MKVAFLGTRGIPARYGGFETAVEEIATRFVDLGIEPVVYCRHSDDRPPTHRGVTLVHLPAIRRKSVETIQHTTLSALHLARHPVDVALLFNGANSFLAPLLRARGMPTAVHVDGLEWRRSKWSWPGRTWHRLGERGAVRFGSVVVADAPGIARYYRDTYGAPTVPLSYGAPIIDGSDTSRLHELGLAPQSYHLAVARFEPENHVDVIVHGHRTSDARLPLVVVGESAYGGPHAAAIRAAAGGAPDVRFLGAVWDQALLDQLFAGAYTYLHGHSVGGTNPALLRAMGAGAPVIAFDVDFNRDIVGDDGRYFSTPSDVAAALVAAEADAAGTAQRGARGRDHVARAHRWDDVAAGYAAMCHELVAGRDPSSLPA